MPYTKVSELPSSVKNVLPKHGQDIYMNAYNSAYDQYDQQQKRRGNQDREEVSHKVAWNAVKNKYHKGDDNKWHPN